jgi:quinol monooxygenase YgiN
MTTTLVTQRRARARQAPALAAAGLRLVRQPGAWSPARLRLRVFQGFEQPDLLLIVSDWGSREAAETYLRTSPVRPPLDALTVGKSEQGFYHELTVYEPLLAPVTVASCTRIACSRAVLTRLLSYMLEVTGPTLRAQPGLASHTLYQNEDRPTQFLSVRGYDSIEAYEAVRRTVAPRLDDGLRERGARLTYFVGHAVADLAPPAAGDEAARGAPSLDAP